MHLGNLKRQQYKPQTMHNNSERKVRFEAEIRLFLSVGRPGVVQNAWWDLVASPKAHIIKVGQPSARIAGGVRP